jgi:hypothetical protein
MTVTEFKKEKKNNEVKIDVRDICNLDAAISNEYF